MAARRYILKGRVQGVGFRYFIYQQARGLDLAGWVRNLENGDVEIHVQGDEDQIQALMNRVRKGPPLSMVQDVQASPVAPEPIRGFSIER